MEPCVSNLKSIGAVIALVVVVMGILIALSVVPATPPLIGCCLAGLAVTRLV